MSNERTVNSSEPNDTESQIKEDFILTGKVPLCYTVRKGLISLLVDPWLTFIKYLSGPVGFKARQLYWRRKLGHMGDGVVIDPDVDIRKPKNIYIDNFAYIGKGAQLVSAEGYIRIGRRCHITGWILGHGGVEIGNFVAIGKAAILSGTDSHQGGHRMSGPMIPMEQRNIRSDKIIIEDDAFIASYSMVLPGITIGQGAIVGPNSLVATNVEPWTVVMGNPATVISKREKVKFPDPD